MGLVVMLQGGGELFHEFALLLVKLGRGLDKSGDDAIAATATMEDGNALAFDA